MMIYIMVYTVLYIPGGSVLENDILANQMDSNVPLAVGHSQIGCGTLTSWAVVCTAQSCRSNFSPIHAEKVPKSVPKSDQLVSESIVPIN